jgi:arylsulfatase A-like enzyme
MRVRDHVLLCSSSCSIIGIVEGAVIPTPNRGITVLVCMGLLGLIGALIGLLQGLVWLAGRRLFARRAAAFFGPRLDPDASDREPVVKFHATVAASAVGLWAIVLSSHGVLRRFDSIGDAGLKRFAFLVATVGLFVAGIGVVVAFIPAFEEVMRRLDRWLTLPRPRRAARRFVIFLGLPSFAFAWYVMGAHGARLGALTLFVYLGLLPSFEALILDLWLSIRRGPLARVSLPIWLAPAATLFFAALPFGGFSVSVDASQAASGAILSGPALRLTRTASDYDRDGASAWLGGGDCAPGDPTIGPFSLDIADNGIDEDCNGTDATSTNATVRPLRWRPDEPPASLAYERRSYNVLWFIVDAVRADHCQVHGYDKESTPYLADLGKSSWVFDRAYSQSSATMLSIPSMLVGLRPASIDWELTHNKLQLGQGHLTLAERLRDEGYRTGAITGDYSMKKLGGMFQGFDDVRNTWYDRDGDRWYGRNSPVATTFAIEWLERDKRLGTKKAKPFFLMVYISDPHDPYEKHGEGFPNFGTGKQGRYTQEIAFSDRYIGMMIEYLRYREPLLDDTIIIFTSDHGEEFGEHGGKIHAYTCYEESTHVPLVVRIPGAKPVRSARPVPLVDIVPTVLDALNLDRGSMALDGASLSLSASETADERPIFCSVLSQKASQGNFARRSVRFGGSTLVRNVVAGSEELYDTATDPGELRDVGRDHPTRVRMLRKLLDDSQRGNLLENRLVE